MKKDCLVFDCDEVLLDHLSGLREFAKKHYNIETTTLFPHTYELGEWLGCEQDKVQDIINHFNQRSYEFGLLQSVESSTVHHMRDIRKKYSSAHIVVLTKSGTFGHGEVLRKVNLINTFGSDVFDEIIIIEMYESKKGALYKLQKKYNVKFLVDDYIKNIETAKELNIPGIMFATYHNLEYSNSTDFVYANNWSVLPNIIDEFMKGE